MCDLYFAKNKSGFLIGNQRVNIYLFFASLNQEARLEIILKPFKGFYAEN